MGSPAARLCPRHTASDDISDLNNFHSTEQRADLIPVKSHFLHVWYKEYMNYVK